MALPIFSDIIPREKNLSKFKANDSFVNFNNVKSMNYANLTHESLRFGSTS